MKAQSKKQKLRIAMLGHKRIPSREGGDHRRAPYAFGAVHDVPGDRRYSERNPEKGRTDRLRGNHLLPDAGISRQ